MRHGTSSNSNRRHRSRNSGRRNNQSRAQVYDSNGPDVRIRGTAHQVAEKYLTLAKDAASSGDRIVAENYYQHAEHYIRIINESNGRFDLNRDSCSQVKQPGNEIEEKKSSVSVDLEDDLSLPEAIIGTGVSIESSKIEEPEEAVE